ncbi:MAG: glycosyltransferase [Blastocatellia bacterium]
MTVFATIILVTCLLLAVQSLLALASGVRFARYTRDPANGRQREYQPKAVILVPCRGLDEEFEENLRPLFTQNYREYELIFITENESDPAHGVIAQMIGTSPRPAWLLVAGEARNRGQKIHNLCAGIEMLNTIDRRTEVLAFADADARPGADWLAGLVAPLGDKRIGATTGFRWFVPLRPPGLAGWLTRYLPSVLLTVWNAGALALLGERSRFAWGGSMAIRRENFDRLRVLERWSGAVSDDYMLSGAVHEARQRIRFVPGALVRSPLSTNWAGLLEFTTRQIRITRVYSPVVWRIGLAGYLFYNLAVGGTLAILAINPAIDFSGGMIIAIVTTCLLGAANGALRAVVAFGLINSPSGSVARWAGQISAHAILNPLISLLYLYNFLSSLVSRRIVWRGISYQMISPSITIKEPLGEPDGERREA